MRETPRKFGPVVVPPRLTGRLAAALLNAADSLDALK
jgi:hypothetical protein